MKRIIRILLSAAAALALLLGCAAADDAELTVTATATVTMEADLAHVTLGVRTSDERVSAATAANAEAMAAVRAALQGQGVAEEDIATSSYGITPPYSIWADGEERMSGYEVTHMLTVTVRDLDSVGAVIDAAVSAGANQIYDVNFLSTKADEAADQALGQAVADARRKAELMAEAAGLKLGGIESMSTESSGSVPVSRSKDVANSAGAGTVLTAGALSVSVTVRVVFEAK